MLDKLTPARRQWLYGVAVSALAVAVLYKVVAPEHVPAWLDLIANILGVGGTGTAAVVLNQQRKDGTL
ncbi:hypothetical protein LT350_00030 [Mycolicibacterium smegmatis]|uniref:hypothetical protein n=1 Tax=Mycolicibacterium smegmatis TaxID=1772 RepID=UPI001E57E33B|nr:hypothetical protein [Mycolicibacterium smegmatis]UGU31398.1 hypothetical protein LT350_00030 [Mycolicibacterium smegmatis]ULN72311.1 hypothetical protein KZ782_10650 [Mycolicibacterium smegmatis]